MPEQPEPLQALAGIMGGVATLQAGTALAVIVVLQAVAWAGRTGTMDIPRNTRLLASIALTGAILATVCTLLAPDQGTLAHSAIDAGPKILAAGIITVGALVWRTAGRPGLHLALWSGILAGAFAWQLEFGGANTVTGQIVRAISYLALGSASVTGIWAIMKEDWPLPRHSTREAGAFAGINAGAFLAMMLMT